MKIVTHYWAKPIPDRNHDWSAHYGDLEGPTGWGATEEAAIRDLIIGYPREDCRACDGWGWVPGWLGWKSRDCHVCHGLGAAPPHHPMELQIGLPGSHP